MKLLIAAVIRELATQKNDKVSMQEVVDTINNEVGHVVITRPQAIKIMKTIVMESKTRE